MRTCESCQRETNDGTECLWCSYNNGSWGGPRTLKSIIEAEDRQQEDMFEEGQKEGDV